MWSSMCLEGDETRCVLLWGIPRRTNWAGAPVTIPTEVSVAKHTRFLESWVKKKLANYKLLGNSMTDISLCFKELVSWITWDFLISRQKCSMSRLQYLSSRLWIASFPNINSINPSIICIFFYFFILNKTYYCVYVSNGLHATSLHVTDKTALDLWSSWVLYKH